MEESSKPVCCDYVAILHRNLPSSNLAGISFQSFRVEGHCGQHQPCFDSRIHLTLSRLQAPGEVVRLTSGLTDAEMGWKDAEVFSHG